MLDARPAEDLRAWRPRAISHCGACFAVCGRTANARFGDSEDWPGICLVLRKSQSPSQHRFPANMAF